MLSVEEGRMNLTLMATESILHLFQRRGARPLNVQSPYSESKLKTYSEWKQSLHHFIWRTFFFACISFCAGGGRLQRIKYLAV